MSIFVSIAKYDNQPYLIDTGYYSGDDEGAVFSLLADKCNTKQLIRTPVSSWPVLCEITDNFYWLHWTEFVSTIRSQYPEYFI